MRPDMTHEAELSRAFDGQAHRFERAPVQSDPRALRRLVAFAALPAGSRVLDAGCGPGLVAEALLEAGHRVHGVDLSEQMVERAGRRCERFGQRARFVRGSLEDQPGETTHDAAVSRYVLHHCPDPLAFLTAQRGRVRPGGVIVACDHTTDPDDHRQAWHQAIERDRDRTHTANLTPGGLVELFARAGLENLEGIEEPFALDFDEWFDRGTPASDKASVRARLLGEPSGARGFSPREQADGTITILCWRALVRGSVPSPAS